MCVMGSSEKRRGEERGRGGGGAGEGKRRERGGEES
jgi:hypothetical protein